MRIYCSTFEGGTPDWLSVAGNWEQMDAYATCNRPFIIMETGEYSQLVSLAQQGGTGGTTSPQFTTEEVAALKYMAANPSPFNLSVEDGYLVSGSIVGVWVVAWAFRALYLTLRSDGEPTE